MVHLMAEPERVRRASVAYRAQMWAHFGSYNKASTKKSKNKTLQDVMLLENNLLCSMNSALYQAMAMLNHPVCH